MVALAVVPDSDEKAKGSSDFYVTDGGKRRYFEEFKQRVVDAYLDSTDSTYTIGERFGVSPSAVTAWVNVAAKKKFPVKAPAKGGKVLSNAASDTASSYLNAEIGATATTIAVLESHNDSLKAQVEALDRYNQSLLAMVSILAAKSLI